MWELAKAHFGCTSAVRCGFSDRLAVGRLRKQPTGVKKTGGCLFFQPAQPASACADSGLRKVSESTVNCSLLFPFTVTLRRFRDARINQRIDSLPCPALFSMFPGRQASFAQVRTPEFRWRGFHQTTTIGLRRLELRLDYARAEEKGRGIQSAKWLSAGTMEARKAV